MPENPITTTRTTTMSGYGTLTLADLRRFVDATNSQWDESARVAVDTTAARDQRDSSTWKITLVETAWAGDRR